MTNLDQKTYRAYREAVSWKTHNGVEYVHVHFKDMNDEDVIRAVKYLRSEVENREPNSVRHFYDASGSDYSLSTSITLRKFSILMQHLILKSGFTGVTGHKLILYNTYKAVTKSPSKLFPTEKEALDYICS